MVEKELTPYDASRNRLKRSTHLPPALVQVLREHLNSYGTGPGGRLFRTACRGIVQESCYGEVWACARRTGRSGAVLLKAYAKCLGGATSMANARIEAALGRWQ